MPEDRILIAFDPNEFCYFVGLVGSQSGRAEQTTVFRKREDALRHVLFLKASDPLVIIGDSVIRLWKTRQYTEDQF